MIELNQPDSAHAMSDPAKPAKRKAKAKQQEDSTDSTAPQQAQIPSKPKSLDLSRLRLSQDFGGLSVKKALLTVPVKKPAKEWWIQTHSEPAYRLDTVVLELKEDNETYLVDPALWPELATESTVSPRALFTAVNSVGVCFLWPIRLPGPDGRLDDWNRSALEAAALASQGKWLRIQSNRSLGAYEVLTSDYSKQPVWPDANLDTLIQRAFKDKYIDTLEHPVLKRLRGEL
jgi:hypothetical protein